MSQSNAELLFLYDAKDTNPNGDPDDENRPRMDPITRRLLVSDVRLKRYLRDYWHGNGHDIWVRRSDDDRTTDADGRYRTLLEEYQATESDQDFPSWFLDRLIDVRLFGATVPVKPGDEARGESFGPFVGPVQFQWGYSLHPVEINPSATISSTFSGRGGEKAEYGTFGKDWRVYYALIAFWGHVAQARGEKTRLQDADLQHLEEGLLRSLSSEATSRSKLGQTPRLYLKVDWQDSPPPFGDPRDYLQMDSEVRQERWRSMGDYILDVGRLAETLGRYESDIASVRYWRHPDLTVTGEETLQALPGFTQL
ncbi:MAG: type I-B CRISPR-associated protein Cas7/Csh2 [Salinibacter sp.]